MSDERSPAVRAHAASAWTLRVLLVAAPLALGSVVPWAWAPLLIAALVAGGLSWARGHFERAHGVAVPYVPLRREWAAFCALVALQLVPWPPALLRLLSPGSFEFHSARQLLTVGAWNAISVSPADTLRGLLFLAGLALLHGAALREARSPSVARGLLVTVAIAAGLTTVVAFAQAAQGDTRIYGFVRARWDWAVFGPYVNRNHYAGHVALALPLALGLGAEALRRTRRPPRPGWRSLLLRLSEREGARALCYAALAAFLLAGLLASRSRGALVALMLAASVVASLSRPRVRPWALLPLALGGLLVLLGGLSEGLTLQAARSSRLEAWQDFARMVAHFPLLGAGFNAFGTAYLRYQQVNLGEWWGETHNEYLQVLVDMGGLGFALFALAATRAVRRLLPLCRAEHPLVPALLVSLLAGALHNVVEYNWQVPANALTFVALLAVAELFALRRLDPSPVASLEFDHWPR